MEAITEASPKPKSQVNNVAPLVAQPGKAFGKMAPSTKMMPHGFQKRVKPVTAVSPVARV
jgi:hypothetical protein